MIPVAEGSAEDEQLRKGMILVGAVCAFMISTPLTVADDWPQFRGIHRNGVSHETDLSKKWDEDSPKEVWRKPLGPGYSAVSIAGDRLYTMYAAEIDGEWKEVAVALSAKGLAPPPGVTATLEVRYRNVTPLDEPLRFESWVESDRGRRLTARATCHAAGKLTAEAHGLFVRVDFKEIEQRMAERRRE